jgi:fructose-1,6-bisphosphatase/inositol monophosphatase family enzyme
VTDDDLVDLCRRATRAAVGALSSATDWGLVPGSAHQHHSDLAADAAAVDVLVEGGLGVLSEESGTTHAERPLVAVLDPLDGSTNAAQGIPWYACSLCVVDEGGPRVAVVTNLASGVEYRAIRGRGAWRCDPAVTWSPGDPSERTGRPPRPGGGRAVEPAAAGPHERQLRSSGCRALEEAVVGLSGMPDRHLGWRQFRALGAAALDLCAVAEGVLDGWVDCSPVGHGVWDYLGGMLVCEEAGASLGDLQGRELVVLDHDARRTPVAGASRELTAALAAAAGLR